MTTNTASSIDHAPTCTPHSRHARLTHSGFVVVAALIPWHTQCGSTSDDTRTIGLSILDQFGHAIELQ
jgi:hypothetical protein